MKCCAAIIVAAGSSRRAGFDKLLAPLHGVRVLERSIRAFANCREITEIVVVCPEERFHAINGANLETEIPVTRVDGGAERHESVQNGLAALLYTPEFVAVHDGARPLITVEHKVFHIHYGKPFRKLFRDGHGEPVGVNNAEGLRHGGMFPDDGGQGFRRHRKGRFSMFQGFVSGGAETPGFHAAGRFRKPFRLFQGMAAPDFKPCGKKACGKLFFVKQVVHYFPPYPMLSSISRSMSLRSSTEYSMGNS